MTCRSGKTDDLTTIRERATGNTSAVCVNCLVDLCLDGGMMHPKPQYEYVYHEKAET